MNEPLYASEISGGLAGELREEDGKLIAYVYRTKLIDGPTPEEMLQFSQPLGTLFDLFGNFVGVRADDEWDWVMATVKELGYTDFHYSTGNDVYEAGYLLLVDENTLERLKEWDECEMDFFEGTGWHAMECDV